jgi:hypothetical protein
MKRIQFVLVLFVTTLSLALAPKASAQTWGWDHAGYERQLRSFDSFLHDHPWIANKLWEKPERVNDSRFLNDCKELEQWLDDHRAAATAFHEDPIGFMDHERHFQLRGAEYTFDAGRPAEFARFDWFLDSHPDIRGDLERRPDLVDRREYLDRHADLREFLHQYPALRQELQEHPREFMEREAR